jgi:hypothetical protein
MLVVSAQSDLDDSFASSLASRQAGSSISSASDLLQGSFYILNVIIQCNATCTYSGELYAKCITPVTPHCGCTVAYLQAQGNCRLCQATSPEDAADAQLFLDGMFG